MEPRRDPVQRGLNVNKEGQAPNESGPMPNEVPIVDVNAALAQMSNVIAMQAGRNAPTPASRIRDFTRMNPPKYIGSKANEDPQDFIEEIFKTVDIVGVSASEKAELAAYQLKGIAQSCSRLSSST